MNRARTIILLLAASFGAPACSGSKEAPGDTIAAASDTGQIPAEAPPSSSTVPPASMPSDSPRGSAGIGAIHDIRMGGEGQGLRFTPASITVAEGDVVRFVSADAGPHDVTFEGAGLSSQAQTQLDRNISERAEPMKSVTLSEAGETVTVSFSGINPGRYAFHCSIHAEAGMNGVIDVR